MDKIKYECKQCGLCCESLVKNINGQKKGLALLPDEMKLFPDDFVAPSMGLGKTPMNVTKILSYQVITSECARARVSMQKPSRLLRK